MIQVVPLPALLAQSITAGEHGSGDHYVDIDPDVTITTGAFSPPGHYEVDVDGDGSIDVEVDSYDSGGGGGSLTYVHASGQGGTSIAYQGSACGEQLALAFVDGQTIDGTSQWSTNVGLSEAYILQGQTQCAYDQFPASGYLGTRRVAGQDTLYGWIRLNTPGGSSFTISEYAGNMAPIGMPGLDRSDNRFIFDAGRRKLEVILGRPTDDPSVVEVYDSGGRPVLRRALPGGTGRMIIPLDGISAGVYSFRIDARGLPLMVGRFAMTD